MCACMPGERAFCVVDVVSTATVMVVRKGGDGLPKPNILIDLCGEGGKMGCVFKLFGNVV